MRSLWWMTMLMMACSGQDGTIEANPPQWSGDAPEAPPPGSLDLAVVGVVPGAVATLTVEGADPGKSVRFLGNRAGFGAGPCPPALGLCIDLVGPVLTLGVVTAGPDGVATLHMPVPAGLSGDVYFQAASIAGGGSTSNGVWVRADAGGVDSDGDGLSDMDEMMVYGTDPGSEDTDGDGYLDGDEVWEGSDPLDPSSVIYVGGWPYFADKAGLSHEPFVGTASVGDMLPHFVWQDQFGDAVDIFDFAGKRTLLHIGAAWAGPDQDVVAWATDPFSGPLFGLYGPEVPMAVAAGELQYIVGLQESVRGDEPSPPDAADFAGAGPVVVPVLCDPDHLLMNWGASGYYPTLMVIGPDMRVEFYDSDDSYDAIPYLESVL
jgi:hypothetical protein